MDDIETFEKTIIEVLGKSVESFDNEKISEAAALITEAVRNGHRVHITGIGKPGDLAHYLAASFSSVGIPTYFLDGTEVCHGSCGQLCKGDVVVFISNSGNTAEMKVGFSAVQVMGVKTIGVTGNAESFLAHSANVALIAKVSQEGGPLNLAPRASILSEAVILQAVSVKVQSNLGFTADEFHKRHQSGALGEMLSKAKIF